MIEFLVNSPANGLREADTILALSRSREGWWGPARLAYDETIDVLRSRLSILVQRADGYG